MARRKKREEKPAKSNRGRPDARGVFIVFEQQVHDEDEPLARDAAAELAPDGPAPARRQGEVRVDEAV
jgi:hypothetical protein